MMNNTKQNATKNATPATEALSAFLYKPTSGTRAETADLLRLLAATARESNRATRSLSQAIIGAAIYATRAGYVTQDAVTGLFDVMGGDEEYVSHAGLATFAERLADEIGSSGHEDVVGAANPVDLDAKADELIALSDSITDANTDPRMRGLVVGTLHLLAAGVGNGVPATDAVAQLDRLAHLAVAAGLLDHEEYHIRTRAAIQTEPSDFNVATLIGQVADLIEQGGADTTSTAKPVLHQPAEVIVAKLRTLADAARALFDPALIRQMQRNPQDLPEHLDKLRDNAVAVRDVMDAAVDAQYVDRATVERLASEGNRPGKKPDTFVNAVADVIAANDVAKVA